MTREQLILLKEELSTDPEALGYSGKTATEIIVLLTTKNIAARRDVKWSTVFKYAMTEGFWAGIVIASKNPDHPAYAAALAAVEMKDIFRDDVINTGLPIFLQLSGGLVSAGLMTLDQKDALVTMGDIIVSRADQLKFGTIYEGNIEEALNYA